MLIYHSCFMMNDIDNKKCHPFMVIEGSLLTSKLLDQPIHNSHLNIYLVSIFFSDSDSVKVKDSQKTDLVEMLESVTYLVCQDDPVQPAQFCKVGVLMIN